MTKSQYGAMMIYVAMAAFCGATLGTIFNQYVDAHNVRVAVTMDDIGDGDGEPFVGRVYRGVGN